MSSTDSAFTITKAASMACSYDINFGSSCGNVFGCIPSATELRASFNNAVIGPPGTSQAIAKPIANSAVHLGVQFVNIPPNSSSPAESFGARDVTIVAIECGSVAERAGVTIGDVLYLYDTKFVATIADLQREVAGTAPGKLVPVKVVRGAKSVDLQIQF